MINTKCELCGRNIIPPENIKKNGKIILSRKIYKDLLDENITCKPKKCMDCFEKRFGKLKRGFSKEQYIFMYSPTEEELKEKFSNIGWTKKKAISLYGEKEGLIKWNSYRKKQAITNTFKYKKEKYGWTEEEFKKYNKSRAITLENMVRKYGEEIGRQKFEEYRKKQAYTNSYEYFKETYGWSKEKWITFNKTKAVTLSNMINRYGEEIGRQKFEEFYNRKIVPYSKISQELFWSIYKELPTHIQEKTYFAELNNEFGKYNKYTKSYNKFDFSVSHIKLCVEFQGDRWHANPKLFKRTDRIIMPGAKFAPAKQWEKDRLKKKNIIEFGFKLFYVWEKDYLENKDKIKEFLIQEIIKLDIEYKEKDNHELLSKLF